LISKFKPVNFFCGAGQNTVTLADLLSDLRGASDKLECFRKIGSERRPLKPVKCFPHIRVLGEKLYVLLSARAEQQAVLLTSV
jgi:hypothetical protein